MKKTLAILSLMICTPGVVFADEVPVADTLNVTQQVEVQNQLDKQTFDKDKFNPQNHYRQNFDKQKNSVKFDKSVNDRKFKKPPKDFKKGQPPKFDKNGRPDFKPDKPFHKGDLGRRPNPHRDFRDSHRPPQHFQNKYGHNPNMKKSHKISHKNLKKNTNRRAYQNIKKR